jgi:hypothetical protein
MKVVVVSIGLFPLFGSLLALEEKKGRCAACETEFSEQTVAPVFANRTGLRDKH